MLHIICCILYNAYFVESDVWASFFHVAHSKFGSFERLKVNAVRWNQNWLPIVGYFMLHILCCILNHVNFIRIKRLSVGFSRCTSENLVFERPFGFTVDVYWPIRPRAKEEHTNSTRTRTRASSRTHSHRTCSELIVGNGRRECC